MSDSAAGEIEKELAEIASSAELQKLQNKVSSAELAISASSGRQLKRNPAVRHAI